MWNQAFEAAVGISDGSVVVRDSAAGFDSKPQGSIGPCYDSAGTLAVIREGYSVTSPPVVIRPILLLRASVNQRRHRSSPKVIDHHDIRVTLLQRDQSPSSIGRYSNMSAELPNTDRKPADAADAAIVQVVTVDQSNSLSRVM